VQQLSGMMKGSQACCNQNFHVLRNYEHANSTTGLFEFNRRVDEKKSTVLQHEYSLQSDQRAMMKMGWHRLYLAPVNSMGHFL